MSSQRIERRLREFQHRLTSLRSSLAVLEEQLAVWTEHYDDARLRSLMSETPQSDHEFGEIRRHYDLAVREQGRLRAEIDEVVRERDELLREWTPKEVS